MSSTKTTSRTLNISQSQELKVLRKIVEITDSELDLELALKEVVSVVTDATKAESVFIYLFDEKKHNLVLLASKIPHKKELGKVVLKAGEGITGWVAKESRPVAIKEGAYRDKRFKGFDVLPEDRYEAFLSLPIIHNKDVIGVINVQHKKSHNYSPNIINTITTVAKLISGVIVNAQLYQENKKKAWQFDSLVKVSQSITSENYLD